MLDFRYATPEVKPFTRKIKPCPIAQLPQLRNYSLQVLLIAGTELPAFTSLQSLGTQKQKLRVKVCMGIEELSTKQASFQDGLCRYESYNLIIL